MTYIDGTTNFPPLLEDSYREIFFQHEFTPNYKEHLKCAYDTPIFYDYADDLMETGYFQKHFGDDYFAIYVYRVCSKCGDPEWADNSLHGNPGVYTVLIRNTPENRYRFYDTEEEEDYILKIQLLQ